MADILSFINSPDIQSHFQEIGYKFNSLEASWIVFQSKKKNLKEKHDAWKAIIAGMPDMELPNKCRGFEGTSLFEYLRFYMKTQIENRSKFLENEDDSYYTYDFYCKGDPRYSDDNGVFSTLEKCKAALDEDMDLNPIYVCISKCYMDEKKPPIKIRYNSKMEIIGIDNWADDSDNLSDLDEVFENLYFEFPMPFKQGDIVCPFDYDDYYGLDRDIPILVLSEDFHHPLSERQKEIADSSDMIVRGHFINENGTVYDDHTTDSYMDMVYYRGPFRGKLRFLKALSSWEQKKDGMYLDLLLCAYRKCLLDEAADDIMLHSWFADWQLELVGLKDKEDSDTEDSV